MDVHLRDLRALIAVAEEGSVTAAADRLYVAQPALSKRLIAIERDVGATLFDRLPRVWCRPRPGWRCWQRPAIRSPLGMTE